MPLKKVSSKSGAVQWGPNRKIGIYSKLWYRTHTDSTYSNESIRIKAGVAHEFYHGVQWGLDSAKFVNDDWNWFTEGQARFIQSAQYPGEEFSKTGGQIPGLRQYPRDANKYLTQYLNTSLTTLSNDDTIMGYPYCVFWRFLCERFQPGGIQLVRDCYAESVGPGNPIIEGKLAIDSAIAEWWRNHGDSMSKRVSGSFNDFLQTLDEFAAACYLNNVPGQWYDPNHVYCRPFLTADTTFKLGASETDSIVIADDIGCSYGFDLEQLRLNGDVDTLRVSCATAGPDAAAGQKLWARLVKVYPGNRVVIEPTEGRSPDGLSAWRKFVFLTDSAERVCLVITRHDTLDMNGFGRDTVRFSVKRAVGVSESLPVTDTVIAGTYYTPKAIVANRGWMKEIFPATFTIAGGRTTQKPRPAPWTSANRAPSSSRPLLHTRGVSPPAVQSISLLTRLEAMMPCMETWLPWLIRGRRDHLCRGLFRTAAPWPRLETRLSMPFVAGIARHSTAMT